MLQDTLQRHSIHNGITHSSRHYDTVILFFTRSEDEDAEIKNIQPGSKKHLAKKAFRCLIQHTQSEATKSGLPVYTLHPENQEGDTFGEKLSNAFRRLYEKGFEKVIAIGNDCPELDAETLRKTNQLLSCSDVVLGPSTDGGTYLIGMRKQAFLKEEFENIHWQTPDVLKELINLYHKRDIHPVYLPVYSDIDTASDLRFLLYKNSFKKNLDRLLTRLRSIFASGFSKFASCFIPCTGIVHSGFLYQRGPPT